MAQSEFMRFWEMLNRVAENRDADEVLYGEAKLLFEEFKHTSLDTNVRMRIAADRFYRELLKHDSNAAEVIAARITP